MKSLKKGFTLIELLIVIAIIAILAVVVVTNVSTARQKAANSKTLTEMSDAIHTAVACIAEEGTVSTPSSGTAICNVASVPGNWPAIAGRSTNGGTWAYAATNQAGGTTQAALRFSAIAPVSTGTYASPVVGDVSILCDGAGCRKQQCTTAGSWATTGLTW